MMNNNSYNNNNNNNYDNGMGRRRHRTRIWLIILAVVLIVLIVSEIIASLSVSDYSYPDFQQDVLENGESIDEIVLSPNSETPTGQVKVQWIDGTSDSFYVTDLGVVQSWLESTGFTRFRETDISNRRGWLFYNGAILIVGLLFCWFLVSFITSQQQNAAGNRMMDFGRSNAKMNDQSGERVTFADVAGLKEEKEDLQEIVDFLKYPDKYTRMGARIPKGVILVGPPGTGKTLLAKAVAGEADVPFFSISGSDFVEMFVGVGASRVRDLFDTAKKNSPCIVFIDEIDAVARRRGTGLGGGHDEREQTLNQLLVEMDGFGVNEGIIVMAATNRADILDPAIMRPGRFDRRIAVGRPDVRGRREILDVHSKGKPLGDDVNLDEIARTTAGFTGADIENLMNEAAIYAVKADRAYITQDDINKAFVKVGMGDEKKSRIISDKEKRITAYHEAGHALLFHLLPDVGPVYSISIIPTGVGAAGYTMPLPERDEMFRTKGEMTQDIIVSMGGRVAEELIFGDVTTGASQDIKQATDTARAMVTQYGMSDTVGMINYGDQGDDVFIGYDLAQAKPYGEETAGMIDREVKRIIDESYSEAKRLISEHMKELHGCAQMLIEREKVSGEEFETLFTDEPKELPDQA